MSSLEWYPYPGFVGCFEAQVGVLSYRLTYVDFGQQRGYRVTYAGGGLPQFLALIDTLDGAKQYADIHALGLFAELREVVECH